MHPSSHPSVSPPHHLPSVSIATYLPDRHLCHLHHPRGKLLHTMSHHHAKQQLLCMEEALYLLERGLLEVLYDDVPMSVQEGYGLMELGGVGGGGGGGGGLDVYVVYAELKGQGWIVSRPFAMSREKRPPPLPPQSVADIEQQSVSEALQDSESTEAHATALIAEHKSAETAAPRQLLPHPADDHNSAQEVGWSELEWGCDDEDERSHCAQLLQLPFLSLPTTVAPSSASSSFFSLLSELPLFFLWPPSTVGSFRRSSPPRPSQLLIVCSNTANEDERLVAALRTPAGVMAVWERAEREMCGVNGKGERVTYVQGMAVSLATVQLTRVLYTHFGPLSSSPTKWQQCPSGRANIM